MRLTVLQPRERGDGVKQWRTEDREDTAAVAAEMRAWVDAVPDSPLYRTLALAASADPEMVRLVARIDGIPAMNLLFAAVKMALTADDALAAWYPHLTAAPRRPDRAAYAAFRDYVLAHADEIVALGASRRTQTNEVGRAAAILPWIAQLAGTRPVHAVDIGAAAGLNLALDRFAYRYVRAEAGEMKEVARLGGGPVRITCEARGPVPLPATLPRFASRTAIDLDPVDAEDRDSTAWLEALVWPEHTDRVERLRAAIASRRETPITTIAGDAAVRLQDVDAALPEGPMLVWHTIALYQASEHTRAAIDEAVDRIARHREVIRIGMEPVAGSRDPEIRVGPSFDGGRTVATAHAHGRWVRAART